jgi:NO-binding membrane sensor protein with MHYT domain
MSPSANSSLLLFTLGTLVAMLAAHVFMGWIRVAQHLEGRQRWGGVALASLVFSSGTCVATAIGLAGESLAFPIGFRYLTVATLWAAAFVVALPVAAWPAHRPGTLASLGAGMLLGALVVALQYGWLSAAGFRPGLVWREEFLALAWLAVGLGYSAAIALALPAPERRGRSEAWRYAGALVMGMATLAGEALVVAGTNLTTQVGSLYQRQLSASLLALVGGGLMPMVFMMMAVDLELRRRERRTARRHRLHRRRYAEHAARETARATGGASPSDAPGASAGA